MQKELSSFIPMDFYLFRQIYMKFYRANSQLSNFISSSTIIQFNQAIQWQIYQLKRNFIQLNFYRPFNNYSQQSSLQYYFQNKLILCQLQVHLLNALFIYFVFKLQLSSLINFYLFYCFISSYQQCPQLFQIIFPMQQNDRKIYHLLWRGIPCNIDLYNDSCTQLKDNIIGRIVTSLYAFELNQFLQQYFITLQLYLHQVARLYLLNSEHTIQLNKLYIITRAYINIIFNFIISVTMYISFKLFMSQSKFQHIQAGIRQKLTTDELTQFQANCSSKGLSLEQWIDISLTIYKQDAEQCFHFLSYLQKYEISKTCFNDYIHQGSKIKIYNNLTGLALGKATRETSKQQSQRWMNEAKKYLNYSEKVRMTVQKSIILNRAYLLFYGGQIMKALNFVVRSYDEIIKTGQGKALLTTTVLMLAQIHFIKKNYQKSLQFYKKALQLNKQLPTKGRLGMAYSFFYLGKYQLARACFCRILKLDSSCVEAYVGIAVIYQKQELYQSYFKYISLGYRINQQHPLILLHLAEHYFIRTQYTKSQYFCIQGLLHIQLMPKFIKIEQNCRNDYQQFKARFNNINGQIQHIHSNYTEAIKFYSLASGKNLIYNQIALAQTYISPNAQNYLQALRLMEQLYKNFEGKDARMLNDVHRLMAYLKSKIPPKAKDEKTAQQYYVAALTFNRYDMQAKMQYANILVQTNKMKALKQLQQCLKIQQNMGIPYRLQLLNNIAVLQLQNNQLQQALTLFLQCLHSLTFISNVNQEQSLKKQSLYIICQFNYAICLQIGHQNTKALEIYKLILKINKFHIDTYLKIGYLMFKLGNFNQCIQYLQEAETICTQNKFKLLKPEKIYSLKAYVQNSAGSSNQAKQTLKLFGKNRDIYTQVFDLCLGYETIMRKGVQLPLFKQFLRPNRQFCYKYCNEDHNAAFAYMLLAIILISDKKLSKQQGMQFFNNLKQFSSDDIPTILYNMGLFLMNYDEYETSTTILNLYKDKLDNVNKGQQIISLNYLLEGSFQHSAKSVKKNILREPSNIRYRLQLAYVTQRRCEKYYNDKTYEKKDVIMNINHLKRCMSFHTYFSKMNIIQYLKGIDIIQMKERLKNIYIKVKHFCEERKYYVKSYIDYYEKIQRELQMKQRQIQQIVRIKNEKKRHEEQKRQLQQLLEQSDDEDERQRKQKAVKRQRALSFAKKRQAQLDQAWNQLKCKDKIIDQQKQMKKRTHNSKKATASKKEKIKQRDESDGADTPEPELSNKSQMSQDDEAPKRRHKDKQSKQHKQKKKLKKTHSYNDLIQHSKQHSLSAESAKQNKNDSAQNDEIDMKKYLA